MVKHTPLTRTFVCLTHGGSTGVANRSYRDSSKSQGASTHAQTRTVLSLEYFSSVCTASCYMQLVAPTKPALGLPAGKAEKRENNDTPGPDMKRAQRDEHNIMGTKSSTAGLNERQDGRRCAVGAAEARFQSIVGVPEPEAASDSRGLLQEQSETVRQEGAAMSPTQGPASPVDEWLAQCKLQRYAGAIKDAGYDEIDFLKEADEAEIDDLASQVEMKVPHAKALKRAWLTLRDT